MNTLTINKETIEYLIAEKYVGATGFVWDGDNVTFQYKLVSMDAAESRQLVSANMKLMHENSFLRGSIAQADKDLKVVMNFDDGLIDTREEGDFCE